MQVPRRDARGAREGRHAGLRRRHVRVARGVRALAAGDGRRGPAPATHVVWTSWTAGEAACQTGFGAERVCTAFTGT